MQNSLKGTVKRDFCLWFFQEWVPPKPLARCLKALWIFPLIRGNICNFRLNLRYKQFSIHCGKKQRKFPSQITDAADHNKPVNKNSEIKFPTSLLDCSAIYIGIFFRNTVYFGIKVSSVLTWYEKTNFKKKRNSKQQQLIESTQLFICIIFMHVKIQTHDLHLRIQRSYHYTKEIIWSK